MSTKLPAVAAICLLFVVSTGAQQPPRPAPTPQTPLQPGLTFKVEVNYVEIDAVVTDAQGSFAGDLKRDDFQVIEDGKPQALTVFSKVDIPIQRADPPLYSKTVIPPDVANNAVPFEGRVFVIVVDDQNTKFSRTPLARQAARQFVERYVGANDLVAVVNTSGVASAMQDFTSNRQLAVRAIDRAMGQRADSATSAALNDYYMNQSSGSPSDLNAAANEMERYNQARNTLRTLSNLADYLGGMHGRRKAVVFFSEGINYDILNGRPGSSGGPSLSTAGAFSRYGTEIQDEYQRLVGAATRANVNIYSVDPRGVTSLGDEIADIASLPTDNSISTTQLYDELRVQQDSLRYVADETGGFAVLNQNDFRTSFGRILEDNSHYYVLGYYASNDKRDGKFRNVQVKVLRPGYTVRARKGYVAPKGKIETPKNATTGTSPDLRDALASPVPTSGLTLSAFAAPFRGPAPKDAVAVAIEIDGKGLPFKNENGVYQNDIEMSIFAQDQNGKVGDGARDTVKLALHPQTYEIVSHDRVRIVRRLMLAPGKYQLRVGAREVNGGNLGTVFLDLDAPDFSRQPLTMSGIAVTSASSSRVPTASPDQGVNEFKDVLPAPPTSSRDFPAGDTLAVFTEIYDNLGKASHRIGITTNILSDDGKVVYNTSDERRSEELQGASGGYGYTAQIPLKDLAPGRYVLRINAKPFTGNSEGITRELEFRIR